MSAHALGMGRTALVTTWVWIPMPVSRGRSVSSSR